VPRVPRAASSKGKGFQGLDSRRHVLPAQASSRRNIFLLFELIFMFLSWRSFLESVFLSCIFSLLVFAAFQVIVISVLAQQITQIFYDHVEIWKGRNDPYFVIRGRRRTTHEQVSLGSITEGSPSCKVLFDCLDAVSPTAQ
jgi:hypothetical protein